MCSIHQSASFPDLPRAMSSCLLSHFLCLVSEVIWSWMQHGLNANNLWFVLNPVLHQYFQFSFLWNLLKSPLLVGRQCKFNHRGRAQDSKLACPICGWDSTLFQKKKKNISMSRDPSRACLHTWNLSKKVYTTQFSGERILHTVNA